MNPLIENILIGLGTGLISGYVSSTIVTANFTKREKEHQWRRELSNDKQQMVRYLDLIQFELNLISSKLNNGEQVDFSSLEEKLVDELRTPSMVEEKITEVSLKHISGTRKLIDDIRKELSNKTLSASSIKKLDSRFIRAKLDVLRIEPRKK
ncbi:hypothetical protein [Bacillus sp. FJAT-27445]|uniref:hypothetical protein n=1 Tax=Bacillus sp. FJAT-27445 TaxID=1679166 RepID=UPI000743E925|nr:hypothetical protein [Bacillus sp. FJAT-27445]